MIWGEGSVGMKYNTDTNDCFLRISQSTMQTLWVDYDSTLSPFLVPTVDGTDIEGVACPQDQSRAVIILAGFLR